MLRRATVASAPAHRLVDATVTVLGPDRRPLADADVTVEQTRHAFVFGNIGFDLIALANGEGQPGDDQLAADWLDLFNTATLPFYWAEFEPVRGRPRTEPLRRAAEWFAARGVALKGHPLAWHSLAPDWLLPLATDEVEVAQRARIRREVTEFAGLIDTWDAINEVVIMPVFDKEENGLTRLARARGRIPTIRLAFEEARAANPAATLLLNDFDLSSAYECLIEGVLEAGTRKPSCDALHALVKGEWWLPPTTLRTDASGRVSVAGFAGDYEVLTGGAATTFALAPGAEASVTVTLEPARG
ncbi:endo-1,4-beta-xylanase [Agromyces sp. NPDC049794]|uniref:endo-1,4-beta-xylanase n=1 Tax=unclassified Agromyces TaxID=2639701 RepID=UPI0033CAE346